MKKIVILSMNVFFVISLLYVSGCETEAQNKALIGGAIGAAAGQAIGRDTEGTLIGAGIGAGAGYIWGKSQDNKEAERQAARQSTATSSNTITRWITNSNGSQIQVTLTRNADGSYTGPKGERYPTLPTDEQLIQAYGF